MIAAAQTNYASPLCSGFGQYHTDSNTRNGPLAELSPHQVRLMVENPPCCAKEKAQWFIPSTLKTRNKQHQLDKGNFYALWADCDEMSTKTLSDLKNAVEAATGAAEALIYTSKSATPDNLKSRVIIILSEPVSGAHFQYGQRVLNDFLERAGIEPDRANESANQICYLPNRGAVYEFRIIEGAPFSLSVWGDEVAAIKADEEAAEKRLKQQREASAKKLRQRLESGSKSPVDAFNAAYDVALMLDTYGYRRRGNRWLSPYSESGTAGVVIKGNRWITSHSSDVAAGLDKSGDAFDLLVHFEYSGDFNAAIKATSEQFTTPEGLTLTKHNQREYMRQNAITNDFSIETGTDDEGEASQKLILVDVSEVMVTLPEKPRFVIDPWLPRRHPTLLGGHGGMGKSNIALVLAAHVATGDTFAGMRVEQGKALFVSLEDEGSLVKYRLRRIIEEYDLNEFVVLENLELLDGTEGYAALMATKGDGQNAPTELTAAYHQIREHAKGKALVVIDNASDAFDANENVRRLVRSFIRSLGAIARENDSSVMLLAHIDKSAARNGSSGNSYSGSTAWHNSSRSRLALLDNNGQRVIEHEKLNVGKKAPPLPITITNEGVPIPMIQLGGANDFTEGQDKRDLVKTFLAAEQAGLTIPARVTPGNGSAMSALAVLEEYPAKYEASSHGRKQASKLLTAMKREGMLIEEEYRNKYRQECKKLLLAENLKASICASTQAENENSSLSGVEK